MVSKRKTIKVEVSPKVLAGHEPSRFVVDFKKKFVDDELTTKKNDNHRHRAKHVLIAPDFSKFKEVAAPTPRPVKEDKNYKINFKPKLSGMLIFVGALLVLAILFKGWTYYHLLSRANQSAIYGSSNQALAYLKGAMRNLSSMDLSSANNDFSSAASDFVDAGQKLNDIDELVGVLSAISDRPELKLASESQKIMEAGALASSAGANLTAAFNSLTACLGVNCPDLKERLDSFLNNSYVAIDNVHELNKELATIKVKRLPVEYQGTFKELQEKSALLEKTLKRFVNLAASLNDFLGVQTDKRYLLIFQNNSELRPSGGFIGSYALADIKNGTLEKLEIPKGGSYDLKAGSRMLLAAPEPLRLVSPLWYFWDANWWPDWRRSAKNLQWFLEKSDGPSTDGVIAVTPTVLEKLLAVTGPIDLQAKYGVIIDQNNFWLMTQSIVEATGQGERRATSSWPMLSSSTLALIASASSTEPKAIIGDLTTKILEELPKKLDKDNLLKILNIFDEALREKQILVYFSDPVLEAKLSKNFLDGRQRNYDNDYLMVVDTNIAGGKSDYKIKQKINQEVNIDSQGVITDKLIITRTHEGIKREALSGVRNVNWLRVYVPKGSQLISASGFSAPDPKYFDAPVESAEIHPYIQETEMTATIDQASGVRIYQEGNYTVLAGWTMVDPGQEISISLEYQLPSKLKTYQTTKYFWSDFWNWLISRDPLYVYSLILDKQPGIFPSDFTQTINLANKKFVWAYPFALSASSSTSSLVDSLNGDKYYFVLIK